jgi:hypothetical protein
MVAGRPEKPIDWERVDKLLMSGCTGMEIAAQFDMHHSTFYRRVEERYGMIFTNYAGEVKQKGDALLREAQYDKAVNEKDNTMLVWLGKTRLGQKEAKDSDQVLQEAVLKLKNLLASLLPSPLPFPMPPLENIEHEVEHSSILQDLENSQCPSQHP